MKVGTAAGLLLASGVLLIVSSPARAGGHLGDGPVSVGRSRRAKSRGLRAFSVIGRQVQVREAESRATCAFDLCRTRSMRPWASFRSS